jgi:hypothetical protein
VLFAGMHVIAWLLARFDARDFRRVSELAYSPELGSTRVADAKNGETLLWTWRFTQNELVQNNKFTGLVSGSAVACAGFIGMPFARLACAIPDTMFGTLPPCTPCAPRSCTRAACLQRRLTQYPAAAPLRAPPAPAGTLPVNKCIGRDDGLCPSRLSSLLSSSEGQQLQRTSRREEGARLKCLADEAPPCTPAADDVPQGATPPDLVTVASTALMHAVLVSWCLVSRHAAVALACVHAGGVQHADAHPMIARARSDDLVVQQRAFITHFFRDAEDVGRQARQFLRLYTIFKEMLISGTLRGAKNWLPKARMWRTILLANDEGFWEPSEQLAFALLANNQAVPPTKLQGFQVIASFMSSLGSMLVGSFISGESNQAAAGSTLVENARAMARRRISPELQRSNATINGGATHQQLTQDERCAAAWDDDDATLTPEDGVEDEAHDGNADPLSFSAAAIQDTVPPALTAALGGDAALAGRVWATTLVAAYLEFNDLFSWRVSPRSTPLAEQQTLLDVAQAWVSAQLAAAPDDDLLPSVARAARFQVRRWAQLHDRRVTNSRGALIASQDHVTLQLSNAASMVHSTLVNGHPVVSLFTSELSIGFARWMGMNVIVSALMAMLVVNIWFCARPSLCAVVCRLRTHHLRRLWACTNPALPAPQRLARAQFIPRGPCAARRRSRCWAAQAATPRSRRASTSRARARTC